MVGANRQDSSSDTGARTQVWVAARIRDIVAVVVLLVALAPLLGFLALLIKADTRGPVFYRCRRVGLGGRSFEMLKFRKMQVGAEGLPLTSHGDPRLTRVGALLARRKLDELPQLWNVLRGEMSLVGPRPEDSGFVDVYPRDFRVVHRVRPGITGLSQLAFAREGILLDRPDPMTYYVERLLPQKIAIDQLYVLRGSWTGDVAILYWTFRTVLLGTDVAVDRE
ncbi:MAG: sugar transferase, partial [Actinomycetota bacterium]|nr:sugar transferase [Actinomycetota bacterium]